VKSAVETLSPTRVRLSIDVDFQELEPFVTSAYKTLAERINIPGFRKGKVPNMMIDQRVGREAVVEEAVNASLNTFLSNAFRENKIAVIGRPTVDKLEYGDKKPLSFTAEVDVRPELKLPNFSEMTIEVEDVVVSDAEVNEQVDALRARFGTLHTVEKAVETGDFVTIDLMATINGEPVEGGEANDISYEVGTNRMVDGLDEALAGLKVGESKRFDTQLVGQKDDEKGAVDVTVKSVKYRELPELNDDFAKLASEFETIAELKADVQTRLERVKHLEQGAHARDILVEKLIESVDIPLPQNIIDDEVNSHLEGEGRLDDATHRAEVIESTTKSLTQEILFDNIIDAEQISVNETELTEYLVRASSRYGMTPDQFIKEVSEAGQVQTMIAEVARAKALAQVLGRVKVVTKSGKPVDLEALAPKQVAPESADSAE
jgi:trigger factor